MAEPINAEALNYITMGIQSEIAAYVFYKTGSGIVTDREVKEAMLRFAGEERRHFFMLEHHYDQYVRSEKWVSYRDIMSRDDLPTIDESMGEKHVKRLDRVQKATSIIDILQIALELEKGAYALYSEAVKAATVPDVRETFTYLSNFELGHIRSVGDMIAQAGK